MSLFTTTAIIANRSEKFMRDFLWSTNDNGNGLHWINWDEVCRPKQEEGLGIRPLRVMNEALKIQVVVKACKGG